MILNFEKLGGLVPAIIQDATTKTVLMLGFMNIESFEKTQETGEVYFFSRTKNRIWKKGENSGNILKVREIFPDCDNDTVLILAEPSGPVCHTGKENCFGLETKDNLSFLQVLERIIQERKTQLPKDSYLTELFSAGLDRIAQKVGEEAVETVIASKNENEINFKNEAADLLFHFLVLLAEKGCSLPDILEVLQGRQK